MIKRICAAAALLAAGGIIGWAGSAGGEPAAPPQLQGGKLVDLSYELNEQTIFWPTAKPFVLETVSEGVTEGGYYYSAYNYSGAEHGGTHLDAPKHFSQGGDAADEIPLRKLVGRAVVVDATRRAQADRDYLISRADIAAHERRVGRIARGSIVLLRTGYGRFWPDREDYLGTAELGEQAVPKLHFPGLHPRAARWLVRRRSVRAVGIDTASIDRGQSTLYESHQVLGGAQVPVFENVANMDKLPRRGFMVVALPMKIDGGSGGPLRAIAIVP